MGFARQGRPCTSMMWPIAVALLGVSSCKNKDGTIDTVSTTTTTTSDCSPESVLTWDTFGDAFFRTWCTVCHSTQVTDIGRQGAPVGVDFDTWEGVVENLGTIQAFALGAEPLMPPAGGVPEADRLLLEEYLTCGAPGTQTDDMCASVSAIDGPLTVSTQSQADELCDGGLSVLGDVTLGGGDLHWDCLCEIQGDLWVDGATEVSLPNLTTLSGNLSAVDAAGLRVLQANALNAIGGQLVVSGNTELQTLSLPDTVAVAGDVSVVDNTLLEALGLDTLSTVGGHLTVGGSPLVEGLDLHRLLDVEGDFAISGMDGLLTLRSMGTVDSVGGVLHISANAGLLDVDGFDRLTSVGGLQVEANPSLETLAGFFLLTEVTGNVLIAGNVELIGVLGLSMANIVSGDVEVRDNPQLMVLNGPVSLTEIGGSLRLVDVPMLTDQSGLTAVNTLGGDLEIVRTGLTGVSDLDLIGTIPGRVTVAENGQLAALDFLGGVHTIGGVLEIADNAALESITGLSALTASDGLLIRDNAMLDHLMGLGVLSVVDGDVDVSRNGLLVGVSPLYTIQSVAGDLSLVDNLTLPTSEADALVTTIGLENIGGVVTVSGNGPG